jgi:alpha-glucuronidase
MATDNPYRPGISSVPSYLADRERNIRHFKKVLTDFPEICSNVRVSGLRGVGKSVLLKKYKEDAEKLGWITISRDLSRKLCQEDELLEAMKEDWKSTTNKLSSTKNILDKTSKFLEHIEATATIGVPGTASTTIKLKNRKSFLIETAAIDSLCKLGKLARDAQSGVVFFYDEAHTLKDQPSKTEAPHE